MSLVGQAYKEYLSPEEQKALTEGITELTDMLFSEIMQMAHWKPETLDNSMFAQCLPPRYLPKYTPLFLKQFFVCILTVSWKLAQPEPTFLASVAEELAAWAIIDAAKAQIELKRETEGSQLTAEEAFEDFIEGLFEDTDVLFLFDDEHDGIDQSAVGQMLGMSSLSFEDWFKPFSDDPSRIVHPYVAGE